MFETSVETRIVLAHFVFNITIMFVFYIAMFYQEPLSIGWEMKTVERDCRMRTKGPKIKAESAVGFLGRGSKPPPHQLRVWGAL